MSRNKSDDSNAASLYKSSAIQGCGFNRRLAVPFSVVITQGSVLGGLIHVISSNDFPACHEEGEGDIYVDDDSDCVHDRDPVTVRNLI